MSNGERCGVVEFAKNTEPTKGKEDSQMKERAAWKAGTLQDVIRSVRGGFSVRCEDRAAATGELGVLKTGAVLVGKFDTKQNKYVPPEEHARLRTPVSANTIIICRKNSAESIGASALVDRDYSHLFLSDLLWELKPSKDADCHWLAHVLKSDFVLSILRLWSTGTQSTMKNISQDRLLAIPIRIPTKNEQQDIVAILQTWDEAIELHDALALQLQKQDAALIYQLVFGSLRIEPYSPSQKRKKYRWFDLPSDWRCERIGSLAREVSERNREAEGAEILSCSKYDGFVRSLEYFKKQVFSSDLTGYKRIHRGDFGFPSNHVEEGSIGLQNLTDIGLVSPIYIVFRFSASKIDNEYAHYVLKTGLYRHIFEVSTSASVDRRGSLRWDEFATIPFPVPSLQEQREIVKVLHLSAKRLAALREERSLLERQKRGLMQKLLTGEWRAN
jgi:type I restriction enzyme S subunit